MGQLRELVARIMSRPLDRSRPLWEMYLVEGLEGGRFALVSKTHQAVIDGVSTVDIGQVVLDATPAADGEPGRTAGCPPWNLRRWSFSPGRSSTSSTDRAFWSTSARRAVADLPVAGGWVRRTLTGAAGSLATAMRTAARPAPGSPLNVPIGAQRRFATVDTRLDDYRGVRPRHGGDVNDVVLATIAGALRTWLFTRGVRVPSTTSVRALVPVSVLTGEGVQPGGGVRRRPAGRRAESGDAAAPDLVRDEGTPGDRPGRPRPHPGRHGRIRPTHPACPGCAGRQLPFPADLQPGRDQRPGSTDTSLCRRCTDAGDISGRPLAKGQALAIGLTSYNGAVCFGLNADRDAMSDLDVLAQCIPDALSELVESAAQTPMKPRRRSRKAH